MTLLSGLVAFSASAETFTCSYEFNPDSLNQSWTTSYRDGDNESFAAALVACERDGGTGIISNIARLFQGGFLKEASCFLTTGLFIK